MHLPSNNTARLHIRIMKYWQPCKYTWRHLVKLKITVKSKQKNGRPLRQQVQFHCLSEIFDQCEPFQSVSIVKCV